MNILGIDTTTKTASCTLLFNDKYYTNEVTNEVTHSEKLLPIINDTLKEANTSLDNIDILSAINGPGSFTGIRIGLATIKAFSQVKELPIFSISSIELIAFCGGIKYLNENLDKNECTVLSLIDAKNDRVYYGINSIKKINEKYEISKILDVKNDLISDVVANVKENNLIIAGDCVEKFSKYLESLNSKYTINLYPSTKDLIYCFNSLIDTSNYMYNAYTLDALYARPSQAERVKNND